MGGTLLTWEMGARLHLVSFAPDKVCRKFAYLTSVLPSFLLLKTFVQKGVVRGCASGVP